MTSYSRERANGVPTRLIDVSEHPRIKRIALGIDVQDRRTAITVHGYTAAGETLVLEHAVIVRESAVVHYGLEELDVQGRVLRTDEVGSQNWQAEKAGARQAQEDR